MTETQQHPLSRLWQYTGAYHRTVVIATTYSTLNKIFDLAPPILIGVAVDVVVQQQDSFLARLGIPDVMTQLVVLGC